MKRRSFGLVAVLFAVAGLGALLVPIALGQRAEWIVTVGELAPETVEVGARATPLQLVFDGTEPIPAVLRTRLVIASVCIAVTIFTAGRWWRSRVE